MVQRRFGEAEAREAEWLVLSGRTNTYRSRGLASHPGRGPCSSPPCLLAAAKVHPPHIFPRSQGPSSSKAWTLPGLEPMENSKRVSQLKRMLRPADHYLLLREASSLEAYGVSHGSLMTLPLGSHESRQQQG